MIKKVIIVLVIVVISALSGVFADRYLFPRLAATRTFQNCSFLKKSAEDVTIIQKTEQVYVKEDSSVEKVAGPVDSTVVKIVSTKGEATGRNIQNPSASWKSGSGVIVTSDGMIMTYASVIDFGSVSSLQAGGKNVSISSPKYKVLTSDGTLYDAELSGIDGWSNLAFLKINASNLPTVSFGNSDEIHAGEKLISIGESPSQNGKIYGSGVLSDFSAGFNLAGKALSSSEKLEGVFLTDLNLNAAFLGGPVIDYSSQVIGITGAVSFDGKESFFQIPSNKVKLAVDRAINKQLGENYYLGIYYVPITREYALANGLSRESGALVFSPSGQQGLAVIAGSPAEKAGLRIGDIISKVDGEEISASHSLTDLLNRHKKGEEAEMTVWRGDQEEQIKVGL